MDEKSRNQVLEGVAEAARDSGVFSEVTVAGGRVACLAKGAAEPAEYRLGPDDKGKLWVSLVTSNRWLSESIETDLKHTGDKIEELLDDELVEFGFDAGPLKVEHFRSEDLLFTFRSPIEAANEGELRDVALQCLLAYEACFRQLGDMSGETAD